jgi:phosphoesterase RecJ-like protein
MLTVNQSVSILSLFDEATRIVCMTHSNPDGDALGSQLGLVHILERRYPGRTILSVCRDAVPAPFQYLPGASAIQQNYEPLRGDLLIILDSAEPKMTEFQQMLPRLFSPALAEEDGIRTVKIDHHPIGEDFAQLNMVDPEAASSCEIIVDIVDGLNVEITSEAATCLLTGIYTDTGSMMHSNTSAHVYRTSARLLRSGADHSTMVRQVFRTAKLSTLKLWGRILEKVSLTGEGGAVSAVTARDFQMTGANFSELTGAIDYINSIPGMRFSLLLSQRNAKVKGSLRTLQEDVDVAAMAQRFSGGGHRKAAGFSLNGILEQEVRWKVVPPPSATSPPSFLPPSAAPRGVEDARDFLE